MKVTREQYEEEMDKIHQESMRCEDCKRSRASNIKYCDKHGVLMAYIVTWQIEKWQMEK